MPPSSRSGYVPKFKRAVGAIGYDPAARQHYEVIAPGVLRYIADPTTGQPSRTVKVDDA